MVEIISGFLFVYFFMSKVKREIGLKALNLMDPLDSQFYLCNFREFLFNFSRSSHKGEKSRSL